MHTLPQLLKDVAVGWYISKYINTPISLCRQNKILLLLMRWF